MHEYCETWVPFIITIHTGQGIHFCLFLLLLWEAGINSSLMYFMVDKWGIISSSELTVALWYCVVLYVGVFEALGTCTYRCPHGTQIQRKNIWFAGLSCPADEQFKWM